MRRSRRARVLHGHADAAVANTPFRVTRGRAASLQRLVVGGFAALDRSAHDAEEEGGVDRTLGPIASRCAEVSTLARACLKSARYVTAAVAEAAGCSSRTA